MATSADEAIGAIGLVRRALLLRAKYRVQADKRMSPLGILGVHPFNRAGVFPMDDTVMSLGLSILLSGFSVDEAHHEGVCVQEVPAEGQRDFHLRLVSCGQQLRQRMITSMSLSRMAFAWKYCPGIYI